MKMNSMAIDAATRHLTDQRARYDAKLDVVLTPYFSRLDDWVNQLSLFGLPSHEEQAKEERRRRLLDSLRTSGAPMTRLLAVLEPQ